MTAFRYDIAVRSDVLCNHVNGAPGDPSVKRDEFLEDALARTNLLRDGRILKYDNPYAKGNEKERFSPITGDRYPVGKNHNSASIDVDLDDDGSYLKVPGAQKENNVKYNNNRRNDRGKFLKRSQSPYARDGKGKEKQNSNQGYKGKFFDENYHANKSKRKDATPSTSKDTA